MINTEIELILKWSQNCVLTEKVFREGKDETQNPKLYVPVVTLQEKYENKLYEDLKTGISFDFEWGRCSIHKLLINQPQII